MNGNFTRWRQLATVLALMSAVQVSSAAGPTDEEQVGEAAAAKILGAARITENTSLQTYVNTLGASLANLTERPGLSWRFAVVESVNVNAFAAPGGIVLITRGLFKLLDSEDELAAVICHEIGHVVGKHHYKVILKQRLTEDATKQLASTQSDKTLNDLSNLSSVIYARGLDKGAEFDADLFAIQLLAKSGYDASALIGVFEKLAKLQIGDSRSALLFSTHPLPFDRLDQLSRLSLESLPPATSPEKRKARFQAAKASL